MFRVLGLGGAIDGRSAKSWQNRVLSLPFRHLIDARYPNKSSPVIMHMGRYHLKKLQISTNLYQCLPRCLVMRAFYMRPDCSDFAVPETPSFLRFPGLTTDKLGTPLLAATAAGCKSVSNVDYVNVAVCASCR